VARLRHILSKAFFDKANKWVDIAVEDEMKIRGGAVEAKVKLGNNRPSTQR
jgi:Pyruvate/2-oxoacid:ferredoxin oxidoreductase gamma subunit